MKNNTLATEIIRTAKKRAAFWRMAFIVTLAAAVILQIKNGTTSLKTSDTIKS